MEMTYEQWKEARKDVKRRMSTTGWTLLIYYAIMNMAVVGWMVVEMVLSMMRGAISGDFEAIESAVMETAESGWGYLLAVVAGFLILLLWKKPRFLKEEVFTKGAPMKGGSFFTILCIFLSGQMVFQIGSTVLELILNSFGYSII